MSDWRLVQGEFSNMAELATPHSSAEIWMDEDHLLVELSAGSGYLRQDLSQGIPTRVLIQMLTHLGYKVTK